MPATKANLLLVEDDVQLRILFTAILMHSGYRVRVAADGFSALTEVRAEMPDVILSDLYMLGMSGFELLSVIRRRFPQIIVVAMSSAFSGGEIPTGVAADAFYQKATSIVDLLNIVQETLSAGDSQLVRRLGQSTPIWVATHPARSADDDCVTIPCPECMRTSDCAPGRSLAIIRQTQCAYCQAPINYAMVQTNDPGQPQDLWRRAETQRHLPPIPSTLDPRDPGFNHPSL